MKIKISICALCLLIASVLFIKPTFAEAPDASIIERTPRETISYYSELFGANEDILMEMARGESGFDQDAFDPDDGGDWSGGLYAYKQDTFDRYSKLMGEVLDIRSYHDQAKLTAWIYVNEPKERRAWTTYRCIQNGGSYTFKYEGKMHTIHCNVVK